MLDAIDDGNAKAETGAQVRAGIALGEVTGQGKKISGAGVEAADGLRDLAVDGGLRVAAAVYEQARSRTRNGFEALGDHTVAGEEMAVFGFDPDTAPEPEPERIGYSGHRRASGYRGHRRHSHWRERAHGEWRGHRRLTTPRSPEDRARFAVAQMKRLYRAAYIGGTVIVFLFLVNVLGGNIDWWFGWPAFFITAAVGIMSFRVLGGSGLRSVADRGRQWFSRRSSWVDRQEAEIRAAMAARGEPDDGRVDRRMRSIRAFRRRARSFAGVAAILFAINLLTSAGDWWFLWPALVMAFVLALSALSVFGLDSILGDDWEDRKRRELVAQFEREAAAS